MPRKMRFELNREIKIQKTKMNISSFKENVIHYILLKLRN